VEIQMAIVKWDPMRDLMILRDRMNRLFEENLQRSGFSTADYSVADWVPPMDIFETPTEIHIQAELPGVNRDTVRIDFDGGEITISGERKFQTNVEEENFIRLERHHGKFVRKFSLPENIDLDAARARLEQGVLEVVIPKVEQAGKMKIKIIVS
jgi:HSP20 family protein